jgi:ParB family chromosome partitioning protein
MRYQKIGLDKIPTEGPGDARFSFSFEPSIEGLANSIKSIGLVRPPILRNDENRLEIVCGLRRVLACKSLGWNDIEALVCEADEFPDERCLRLSLLDNDAPGRLSPIERAIALKKFHGQGYDAEKLAREIAPLIDVPASRKYVEECLELLSMDDEVLRSVHDGSLGIDQALGLLKLEASDRLPAFQVLLSCRANLNETRELLSMIPDVAAMKNLPVPEFIDSELGPILNDDSLQPRKRLERLRDILRQVRYPRLTEAAAAFADTAKDMRLGERCRIAAPKNFEGDELTITIKARDADQVAETVEKLLSAGARQALAKLFSILRGPQ